MKHAGVMFSFFSFLFVELVAIDHKKLQTTNAKPYLGIKLICYIHVKVNR